MVAVALPPNPANKTLRLELTQHYLSEYSELERILLANMFAVQKNQYSLEILLTIARLCKQNLQMIVHISEIEKLLVAAADSASEAKPAEAVAALDLRTLETTRESDKAMLFPDYYPSTLATVPKDIGSFNASIREMLAPDGDFWVLLDP